MDNGNDPPARTSNLKFSDEKQKIIKQWPNLYYHTCMPVAIAKSVQIIASYVAIAILDFNLNSYQKTRIYICGD